MTLDELYTLLSERKTADPASSYTASLYRAGIQKIAQKVGEEGVEVVIAALAQSDERLIEEISDLTYHTLVLMAERGIRPERILAELDKRHQPKHGE